MYDHFGPQKIKPALNKLRFVYITHLHGDHQYGMFKVLIERDRVISKLPEYQRTKLYMIVPVVLLMQLELFVKQSVLSHPECLVIVNSSDLNPEKFLYYQREQVREGKSCKDLNELYDRPLVSKDDPGCVELTAE